MTTTNEGGNISNPAWNLFFANHGTFSRLRCHSECTKSALDRHRRVEVLTRNEHGPPARRVTELFCAAGWYICEFPAL
jgi:hypothetical protein